MFTVALNFDLIHVVSVRTVRAAVHQCGRNLTPALLVSAFVRTLYISYVVHGPPHSLNFADQPPRYICRAHGTAATWAPHSRIGEEESPVRCDSPLPGNLFSSLS